MAACLVAALLVPFANKLPISAQRCLTLLPLELDRGAIEEARGSTDWRLEMWRVVWTDIPNYLLVGKGYAIDPKDLYFAQQNISLRSSNPYETALVAGDIAIVGFNATFGNTQFAFVLLKAVVAGTVIRFTDAGLTGSALNV